MDQPFFPVRRTDLPMHLPLVLCPELRGSPASHLGDARRGLTDTAPNWKEPATHIGSERCARIRDTTKRSQIRQKVVTFMKNKI